MVGLWIIWDYRQHTNRSVWLDRHGRGRGLLSKAIRELEGYAGNKLGSIIEQPCSYLSMRIRAKIRLRASFTLIVLSFHEQVAKTSCFLKYITTNSMEICSGENKILFSLEQNKNKIVETLKRNFLIPSWRLL